MINKLIISKITLPHLFVTLLSFFIPIKAIIILVGVMIFLDTILGVTASVRNKISITSKLLSSIVSKMILYQSAVILIYCIEYFILGDLILMFTSTPLFLTKVVATLLVGIEFLSITENINKGWGINVWTKLKNLLKRSKEVKSDVNEIVDNIRGIKEDIDEVIK